VRSVQRRCRGSVRDAYLLRLETESRPRNACFDELAPQNLIGQRCHLIILLDFALNHPSGSVLVLFIHWHLNVGQDHGHISLDFFLLYNHVNANAGIP